MAQPVLSPNRRGALLALLAFALYATHDVVIKTLGASMSPVLIVFFSVLLSFPLATLLLIRDRTDGNLRPLYPGWMALRTGATVVAALSAFYAFSVVPMAQVYAILFAMPLLITVLSIPILGETVRLRRWLAVLAGLVGVLIVLRPGTAALQAGHAAALLGAVGAALGAVVLRKIGPEERPPVLVLYPMLGNFVVTGALLPLVYRPITGTEFAGLGMIAALGFVAMLLTIRAYRMAEAVVVAPMQYSQILWATFFGALLFDEWPDLATGIGSAIIIASGIYILLREGRAEDSGRPVQRSTAEPRATPAAPLSTEIVRQGAGE